MPRAWDRYDSPRKRAAVVGEADPDVRDISVALADVVGAARGGMKDWDPSPMPGPAQFGVGAARTMMSGPEIWTGKTNDTCGHCGEEAQDDDSTQCLGCTRRTEPATRGPSSRILLPGKIAVRRHRYRIAPDHQARYGTNV